VFGPFMIYLIFGQMYFFFISIFGQMYCALGITKH